MKTTGYPAVSKRAGVALAAIALVTLGGCGRKSERVQPLPTAPEAAPSPVAKPDGPQAADNLTPTQRLARVVELLNQNDEKTARVELDALLAQEPNRREALVLEKSIKGNPYAIVPRNSFSYVVAPGDTYISLALDYLGDSYKFYALARISGIAANMLKPGDIIQIPGRFREPSRPGVKQTRTPPARPRSAPRATTPTEAAAPVASVPQSDPAQASRYRRQGLEQMTAGRIDSAVARLTRAQQLDPDNRAIAADLARARRIQGSIRSK